MRHRYDLAVTRYICDRPKCQTLFDIPSDTLYEFASADDSNFWCPACECEPWARLLGTPASDLPRTLQLPQQFSLQPVPRLAPSDDVELGNLMYRPYSQRSFLRQYLDWLVLCGVDSVCDFHPSATCFKKFDADMQRYTDDIDYELVDECSGSPCQFLRTETVKPLSDSEIGCRCIKLLCTTQPPYGLCQTKDEANILRNFLLISGGDHFPMLIPQPSILSGAKRPDFLCFIPITKFQYQPVAVLVDRPGKRDQEIDNENSMYGSQGYRVKRILVDWESGFSYFKAARDFKNWVEEGKTLRMPSKRMKRRASECSWDSIHNPVKQAETYSVKSRTSDMGDSSQYDTLVDPRELDGWNERRIDSVLSRERMPCSWLAQQSNP